MYTDMTTTQYQMHSVLHELWNVMSTIAPSSQLIKWSDTEQHQQYTQRKQSTLIVCISVLSYPPKTSKKRESLANAKVSMQQPWYIGRNALNRPPLRIAQQYQRNLYIFEKYFHCATIPSLTMRVYLHSFSHCCLPKDAIWTYSS